MDVPGSGAGDSVSTVGSMKARLATVLSLAGVLVTGSAAALVNSEVLQPAASATQDGVPAQSIAQTQSSAPVGPEMPPPAATQAIYMVDGAGLVTLDTAGEVLTVVHVTANDGWTIVSSANVDPTNVLVSLQSGTTLVEFSAALLYGVVSTSVATTDLSTTTVPAPLGPVTQPTTRRSTVKHSIATTTTAGGHEGHEDDHQDDD